MTSPDPTDILGQINSARDQTYQNIATAQGILDQANAAASGAARDRAAIQAIAQQTVSVDTSVGTRVFAGDTMIYGYTGERNVASLLLPGWTGDIYLARTNTLVTLQGIIDGTEMEKDWFLPDIKGFGPRLAPHVLGLSFFGNTAYHIQGASNVLFLASGSSAKGKHRIFANWHTKDPWPTSLPGTAA